MVSIYVCILELRLGPLNYFSKTGLILLGRRNHFRAHVCCEKSNGLGMICTYSVSINTQIFSKDLRPPTGMAPMLQEGSWRQMDHWGARLIGSTVEQSVSSRSSS